MSEAHIRNLMAKIGRLESQISAQENIEAVKSVASTLRQRLDEVYDVQMGRPCRLTDKRLSGWVNRNLRKRCKA